MIPPALVLAAALLAAPTTKMALMPVRALGDVSEATSEAITTAVGGEVRRVPGVQLISQQEISSLLGLERQKQLLACSGDDCTAEIGGALGVDRLVSGSLAKVGESYLFSLTVLDVKKAKAIGQTDRRLRKGSLDDVLDVLPAMVAELFGAAPAAGPMVARVEPPRVDPAKVEPPAPAAPTAPPATLSPVAQIPLEPRPRTEELKLVTDGKGLYVAYPAAWDSFSERLFVGDGEVFWQQRVFGGGSGGSDGTFSYSFWDPRARKYNTPSLGVDHTGKFMVWCGERHDERAFELQPVADKQARKLLGKAKFMKPRFQRRAWALARDDMGNYFYVDRAREPEDTGDFRLYQGTKRKLQGWELSDRIADSDAEIFIVPGGRLRHARASKTEAEWLVGSQSTKLRWLPIEDNGQFVYTDLGVYAGERLGTACDPVFAKP